MSKERPIIPVLWILTVVLWRRRHRGPRQRSQLVPDPSEPGRRPFRPTLGWATVRWRTDRRHRRSAQVCAAGVQQGLAWRRSHGVVGFAGELDLRTGPLLERYFATHPGPARLDLRDLTFVDASGLHALEQVRERCRANGWSFTIGHCSCAVLRLLRLVGSYDDLVHTDRGRDGRRCLSRR